MVPIGQELEKTFSFSCDVPIQFEYKPPPPALCCCNNLNMYKLSSLDANNDFTIEPMGGIIPAEGTVQVRVLFRPTRLYTSLQKVLLPSLLHSCCVACCSHTLLLRFPSAFLSLDSTPSLYVHSQDSPPAVKYCDNMFRCSCAATRYPLIPCRSRRRYYYTSVPHVVKCAPLIALCCRWRTRATWDRGSTK